jgi:hypothetical protein
MALVLAEQKIPALIIAHITARNADGDYPTPNIATLPLVAGPVKESTKRVHPSLEVWVPSIKLAPTRDWEVVDVMLDLHANSTTVLATELGWWAAVLRSFAGGPIANHANVSTSATNPFMAYLNALTAPEKADWAINDFHITARSIVVLDEKRVMYRAEAQCQFRSYVCTV